MKLLVVATASEFLSGVIVVEGSGVGTLGVR